MKPYPALPYPIRPHPTLLPYWPGAQLPGQAHERPAGLAAGGHGAAEARRHDRGRQAVDNPSHTSKHQRQPAGLDSMPSTSAQANETSLPSHDAGPSREQPGKKSQSKRA